MCTLILKHCIYSGVANKILTNKKKNEISWLFFFFLCKAVQVAANAEVCAEQGLLQKVISNNQSPAVPLSPSTANWGRQVAQSVEGRTLEAEVRSSKPVLGTWWWGRIPPIQPHPKGAAPAATTLLAEW